MVGNPETPGIRPDTPVFEHSGESSGCRPGNYGLGSPDTPGINPDTPEISGNSGLNSGYSGFCRSVGVGVSRVVVRVYGLGLFQSTNHTACILISYAYV